MDRDEEAQWLLLQHLCGASQSVLRKLQFMAAHPGDILEADEARWRSWGVAPVIIAARAAWRRQQAAHPATRAAFSDQQALRELDACLLAFGRPGYPALLAEIHDPPPLLYVRGDPALLQEAQLAVVGSRKTSQAGRRAAAEFSASLVGAGLLITSGLALGIDAVAHQSALEAGGQTIGVLATGIDRIYPRRNARLAAQICTSGVLVSEFPLGMDARREYFPQRNRVISGLSLGVLVVEAALRSGSLITARLALEQNREVFALPQSIYHAGGRGCNELLRQGATLVESREDMLQQLGSLYLAGDAMKDDEGSPAEQLPRQLEQIYHELGYEPTTVDELVADTGLESRVVLGAMVELQLRGLVEQNQGRYMRC